jgi:hypothetical protein
MITEVNKKTRSQQWKLISQRLIGNKMLITPSRNSKEFLMRIRAEEIS